MEAKKVEDKKLDDMNLDEKRRLEEKQRLEEKRLQDEKRFQEKRSKTNGWKTNAAKTSGWKTSGFRIRNFRTRSSRTRKSRKPRLKDAPFPRRTLVVSVNEYLFANPLFYGNPRAAQFPGSSPREISKQLNKYLNFPARQCAELCDRNDLNPHAPIKSVIEGTITEFLKTMREQDRIVLLFTGHATEIDKVVYLVPLEGDLNDAKTLIPLTWCIRNCGTARPGKKCWFWMSVALIPLLAASGPVAAR